MANPGKIMLRRYLCMGDEPETGGTIEPYPSRPFTICGYQVAIIGGKAFCAACKATGRIAKAGGPRRHNHCGNEVALDGDVLLCKCSPPPRMLAKMQSTAWYADAGSGNGKQATAKDVEPVPTSLPFDEQVTVRGRGASEGYPYFIEVSDGQHFTGCLDGSGRLPRVYTASADSYTVYWGDEALARQAEA